MKSILKKILFGNRIAKNFPAIRIENNSVKEKVFLSSGNSEVDITNNQCIVCHDPFFMAAWLTADTLNVLNEGALIVTVSVNATPVASLDVSVYQKFKDNDNSIVIFMIDNAKCRQLNSVRQYLLHRYFKNKTTPLQTRIYGALYSYPRRVVAVSYRDNEYYNIFPMDFQCRTDNDTYILGLRTTNVTLDKILASRKVVIADTDQANLETIYLLGSHHSNSPTPVDKLPFNTTESEIFKFLVPDFAASYNEVEIVANQKLGTHMLMIGKIINSNKLTKGNSSIYHTHFFQLFKSDYAEA